MMYYAPLRNLHIPSVEKVRRSWLEKVERLGGNCIVQLPSMLSKISPDGDYTPAGAHEVGYHRLDWGRELSRTWEA